MDVIKKRVNYQKHDVYGLGFVPVGWVGVCDFSQFDTVCVCVPVCVCVCACVCLYT